VTTPAIAVRHYDAADALRSTAVIESRSMKSRLTPQPQTNATGSKSSPPQA
jgi:hypothetical protein